MVQDRPVSGGAQRERGGRGDQALRRARTSTRRWSRRSRPRSAPKRCPREARLAAGCCARLARAAAPAAEAAPGDLAIADEGNLARQHRAACCVTAGGAADRAGSRRRRCATRGRSPWRPAARCWSPTRAPRRLPDHAGGRGHAPSAAARARRPGGHRARARTGRLRLRPQRDAVLRLDLADRPHHRGAPTCATPPGSPSTARQAAGDRRARRCAVSTRAPAPSRPPRRARRSTARGRRRSRSTARCSCRRRARAADQPTGAKSVRRLRRAARRPERDRHRARRRPSWCRSAGRGHPRRPRHRR
jgi:hypothetical protein